MRSPRLPIPALPATLLVLATLAGCGPSERSRAEERARANAPSPPATRAAVAGEAAPDTLREGPAFVARWATGAYEEVRIVRATDGAIVVGGACRFPDGTRIGIALLRPAANGGQENAAATTATVALGRFMGGPLVPVDGAPPPGTQVVRLTTPFGPGDQAPEVLRAAEDGRRFVPSGGDARPVHEITLEAPL